MTFVTNYQSTVSAIARLQKEGKIDVEFVDGKIKCQSKGMNKIHITFNNEKDFGTTGRDGRFLEFDCTWNVLKIWNTDVLVTEYSLSKDHKGFWLMAYPTYY